MSTTVTGLGSGLDISSWIEQLVEAKTTSLLTPLETKLSTLEEKSSAISTLESKFSTLQSALQTFTKTIYNSSSDMWTNTTITSSNTAYATATSSGVVSASSIELEIEQIATATTASSVNSLGSTDNILDTTFTNLANGQATSGTFTMFLNGKEYQIDIASDDTVQDVIDKIEEASGGLIQASVSDDGYFTIQAYKEESYGPGGRYTRYVVDEDATLTLGASNDESNLASALKLNDQIGTYGYTSSYAISTVNSSKAMASEESGLGEIKFYDENGNETTSGTITINGVDFTVDETTTLDSLISKINGNSDANVKATYDSLTGKLILTSTETGASNISITSNGTTNLLNVLGLTEGEGDDEILATGSQTLGQNAIVYINGNKVISTSNTITGESSGIANLSITVKKPTSEYSSNADDDKSVTLDIEPDYTEVEEALEAFVDAYNDVVTTTKSYLSSSGAIGNDSSLNSILSQIRSLTSMVSDNDGAYSMLAEIGISTSSTDTTQLSIDYDKLEEALSEDFTSVKLLLSDGYTSKDDTGIFDQLVSTVSSALNSTTGYFTNASTSVSNQITSLNSKIERANTKISNYEARITAQFNKMDSTIASLNSQLSTFQAYIS